MNKFTVAPFVYVCVFWNFMFFFGGGPEITRFLTSLLSPASIPAAMSTIGCFSVIAAIVSAAVLWDILSSGVVLAIYAIWPEIAP